MAGTLRIFTCRFLGHNKETAQAAMHSTAIEPITIRKVLLSSQSLSLRRLLIGVLARCKSLAQASPLKSAAINPALTLPSFIAATPTTTAHADTMRKNHRRALSSECLTGGTSASSNQLNGNCRNHAQLLSSRHGTTSTRHSVYCSCSRGGISYDLRLEDIRARPRKLGSDSTVPRMKKPATRAGRSRSVWRNAIYLAATAADFILQQLKNGLLLRRPL